MVYKDGRGKRQEELSSATIVLPHSVWCRCIYERVYEMDKPGTTC